MLGLKLNDARGNVLLMICIFVLAGAFASVAKTIGGVQAMVDMSLWLLPQQLILVGIFIASCLVSLSVGTSCGTIAALTPIAVGMSGETGYSVALLTGVVAGGALFGDNLSFISDTTIAATRTLGCKMKDKFKANITIALPAAVVTMLVYAFLFHVPESAVEVTSFDMNRLPLTLPYLFILVCALVGVNVLVLLAVALVLSMGLGLMLEWQWTALLSAAGEGVRGMEQLIIVTLVAAVAVEAVKYLGWMDKLMVAIKKKVNNCRVAEFSMAFLVVAADVMTANNTIAILTVGPLCREMSEYYGVEKRRAASILDTFSCTAQGFLPYGAQLLIAAGLAGVSPLNIIPYLVYPLFLGIVAVIYMLKKY